MTRFARRFRKVSRRLSRVELMRSSMDEAFALDERDLMDREAGRRFLDFYGDEGLRLALERYGFLDALRVRGWAELHVQAWAHDERHTLLIDGESDHDDGPERRRQRLLELVVRRDRLTVDPPEGYDEPLSRAWDVLTVDWLSLRNPRGRFTEERLRLPGQDAAGLGVGEQVLELLYRVVDRLELGGLLTVAEYFHNAVLYARELPFVDPWYQGQLHALEELLFHSERLSFAQAAWAVHWGFVRDASDRALRWRGEAMVRATEPSLRRYVTSRSHARLAEHAQGELRYRLDRTAFDERWQSDHPHLLGPPRGDDPDR